LAALGAAMRASGWPAPWVFRSRGGAVRKSRFDGADLVCQADEWFDNGLSGAQGRPGALAAAKRLRRTSIF